MKNKHLTFLPDEQLAHLKNIYEEGVKGPVEVVYRTNDKTWRITKVRGHAEIAVFDTEINTHIFARLHNTFPAIYKELLAARELVQVVEECLPKCDTSEPDCPLCKQWIALNQYNESKV